MLLPCAVPVTLTASERTILKKRARGAKTAYRDRLRAQIVLAAARGFKVGEVVRATLLQIVQQVIEQRAVTLANSLKLNAHGQVSGCMFDVALQGHGHVVKIQNNSQIGSGLYHAAGTHLAAMLGKIIQTAHNP